MQRIEASLKDGWPCFALSNHDVVRSATRWTKDSAHVEDKVKAMLIFLLTQRGTPCLYQGEELGLPEADVPFEKIVDPFGIEFWPDFKGRDGCRTPIAWENNNNLGFGSDATLQWLPPEQNHKKLAISEQKNNDNSMLAFMQAFLKWRKTQSSILSGSIKWLDSTENVLLFDREDGSQKLTVCINFSENSETKPDIPDDRVVWTSHELSSQLAPYQCTIWDKS
jgi:alpha-glucosidase